MISSSNEQQEVNNISDKIARCIERANNKKEKRIVFMLNNIYNSKIKDEIINNLQYSGYIVSSKNLDYSLTELIIMWR